MRFTDIETAIDTVMEYFDRGVQYLDIYVNDAPISVRMNKDHGMNDKYNNKMQHVISLITEEYAGNSFICPDVNTCGYLRFQRIAKPHNIKELLWEGIEEAIFCQENTVEE